MLQSNCGFGGAGGRWGGGEGEGDGGGGGGRRVGLFIGVDVGFSIEEGFGFGVGLKVLVCVTVTGRGGGAGRLRGEEWGMTKGGGRFSVLLRRTTAHSKHPLWQALMDERRNSGNEKQHTWWHIRHK